MTVLEHEDPRYPPLLRQSKTPPARLYVRGDPALLLRPSVAIVGSRAATRLGLEMAERLGAGVAREGVVVVSGCARGIDAAAHRAALDVGGTTVGVLAGGLDVAAPALQRPLAARIARAGCLVGEHPDGHPPAPYLFPERNRIIAGLVRVVVVVEAAGRSGALITARHALDAGREVMAVPGHPLLPNAAGVGKLLRDGARPALAAQDVLEELAGLPAAEGVPRWVPPPPPEEEPPPDPGPGAPLTARLAAVLGRAPARPDELAEALGAELPEVLAALTELELTGTARMVPGQRYGLVPRRPPDKSSGT